MFPFCKIRKVYFVQDTSLEIVVIIVTLDLPIEKDS